MADGPPEGRRYTPDADVAHPPSPLPLTIQAATHLGCDDFSCDMAARALALSVLPLGPSSQRFKLAAIKPIRNAGAFRGNLIFSEASVFKLTLFLSVSLSASRVAAQQILTIPPATAGLIRTNQP